MSNKEHSCVMPGGSEEAEGREGEVLAGVPQLPGIQLHGSSSALEYNCRTEVAPKATLRLVGTRLPTWLPFPWPL